MEVVFNRVDSDESQSLAKLFFAHTVDLSGTSPFITAVQHRPEYEWLVNQLGPCALSEKRGLYSYDFYPSRNWTVFGRTYYFRDEKAAALFKLFWLT